ncbi:cinnamoyl-CoA reductase 2-like isoform X2 [Tasmannia lanceolata]|uniref:cinnamoyl-CoA reductase 2-like isoform X2 n=1 Tax=Tasmannia lanceolata TaxID=3420 RepID=UPI0040628F48
MEKGRVCVTGAGGYVASWVVKLFLSEGYIVHGTVRDPEPSVTGTQNVLKACSAARVKRVVVVSSIATVMMNPNWPQDRVMDENCWSDMEYCKKIENVFGWYCLAKTAAEREALEYGEKSELEVVTVCPAWIIGPLLQPNMNYSSMIFTDLLKGYSY